MHQPSDLHRLVAAIDTAADIGDQLAAVTAVHRAAGTIRELLAHAMSARGDSYSEIGRRAGISRQAARKRYPHSRP